MQDQSIPFGTIPYPQKFSMLSPWEQWMFLRKRLKNGPRDEEFDQCWSFFFSNTKQQVVFIPQANIVPLQGDEIYDKTEEKHFAEQAVIDDILLFQDLTDNTGTIFEQLQLFPEKYKDAPEDCILFLQEELRIWRKLFFEYYRKIPKQIQLSTLALAKRNYEKIEETIINISDQRLDHAFGRESKRSAWLQKQFAHGYEVALLVFSFVDDSDCYSTIVTQSDKSIKIFSIRKAIKKAKNILENGKRSLKRASKLSAPKSLLDLRTLQKHFSLWSVCNYLYTFYHFETAGNDDDIKFISLKFLEQFFAQNQAFDDFRIIDRINNDFCLCNDSPHEQSQKASMGSDTEHRKAKPQPNKFRNFAGIFFDFVNWQKSVKSSCAQPLAKIDKAIQETNNLLSKYLAEGNLKKILIYSKDPKEQKEKKEQRRTEYCMRLGIGKHIYEQKACQLLPPKDLDEISAMLFGIAKEFPGELLFVVTTIAERYLARSQTADNKGAFSWMQKILDIDPSSVKFGNRTKELCDFRKLIIQLYTKNKVITCKETRSYFSWIKCCVSSQSSSIQPQKEL